jgi:hypothetical protein
MQCCGRVCGCGAAGCRQLVDRIFSFPQGLGDRIPEFTPNLEPQGGPCRRQQIASVRVDSGMRKIRDGTRCYSIEIKDVASDGVVLFTLADWPAEDCVPP